MIGQGYFGTQPLGHALLQLSHLKWYLGPEHTHVNPTNSRGVISVSRGGSLVMLCPDTGSNSFFSLASAKLTASSSACLPHVDPNGVKAFR